MYSIRCEHCGKEIDKRKEQEVGTKWDLCDSCKAKGNDAYSTHAMVEFAEEINKTLNGEMERLEHLVLNFLNNDPPHEWKHDRIDYVKKIFETEKANWRLWLKRTGEFYGQSRDGTMYAPLGVYYMNDCVKYRIEMLESWFQDVVFEG